MKTAMQELIDGIGAAIRLNNLSDSPLALQRRMVYDFIKLTASALLEKEKQQIKSALIAGVMDNAFIGEEETAKQKADIYYSQTYANQITNENNNRN